MNYYKRQWSNFAGHLQLFGFFKDEFLKVLYDSLVWEVNFLSLVVELEFVLVYIYLDFVRSLQLVLGHSYIVEVAQSKKLVSSRPQRWVKLKHLLCYLKQHRV